MLDALTAEKVFGWKRVHKHGGALVGRKQDRAGHFSTLMRSWDGLKTLDGWTGIRRISPKQRAL
jgi:hypothetical protein